MSAATSQGRVVEQSKEFIYQRYTNQQAEICHAHAMEWKSRHPASFTLFPTSCILLCDQSYRTVDQAIIPHLSASWALAYASTHLSDLSCNCPFRRSLPEHHHQHFRIISRTFSSSRRLNARLRAPARSSPGLGNSNARARSLIGLFASRTLYSLLFTLAKYTPALHYNTIHPIPSSPRRRLRRRSR